MHEDPFGELRSLLQGAPGAERWGALVALLEAWADPEDLTRRAVPYALDILRKEPGPRPAPLTWLGAIYDDPEEPAPLLPLADTLAWAPYDGLEDDTFARTLLERHDLGGVRDLSLEMTPLSERTLHELAERLGPRLESLALWYCVMPGVDSSALLEGSTFPRLESLDLGANILSHLGWPRPGVFPSLTRLRLAVSLLNSRTCEALARAPFVTQLTALDGRQTQLVGQPLREILSRLPETLESLRLGGCPLENADLLALCTSSFAPGLRVLDLGDALHLDESQAFGLLDPLEATTAREDIDLAAFIAHSGRLTSLHRFDLHQLRPPGYLLPLIARAEHLRSVRVLDLSINALGVDGIDALLKTPMLEGVHTLDLSFNDAGPDLGEVLRRASSLDHLRELSLRGNDLSGAGIEQLSTSSFFGRLERLDMYACWLDVAAVTRAIEALSPDRIRDLDLSGNPIDDRVARALVDADLRALERLLLDRGSFSSRARTSLRVRYPFVHFVY